jgi:endonuclease/exonuclease/phosphatase family metal-dependent hydrolase
MTSAAPARFTVATYNIHKGFSQLARRVVIHELRERLHGLAADILFLQEVLHTNDRHANRYRDWPRRPQHEFIAGEFWNEVAYGRNAVYPHGHQATRCCHASRC